MSLKRRKPDSWENSGVQPIMGHLRNISWIQIKWSRQRGKYGIVVALVRSVASQSIYSVHAGVRFPTKIPIAAITVGDAEIFGGCSKGKKYKWNSSLKMIQLLKQTPITSSSKSREPKDPTKYCWWVNILIPGTHDRILEPMMAMYILNDLDLTIPRPDLTPIGKQLRREWYINHIPIIKY